MPKPGARTTREQDDILRAMWVDPTQSVRAIARAAGRDTDWVRYRRAKLGLPPRDVGQVPCAVRDRALLIKQAARRTWDGIANECQLDPKEVKRWGEQWHAGPREMLERIARWCDEGEGRSDPQRRPQAPPPDLRALLPVEACVETVTDWLYAEYLRRGHKHDAAIARVNILTARGRYVEANAMRLQYGLSPFAPISRSLAA
jgi:hypothetical protein